MVHACRIAQQGLIDASGHVETEVGILRHTHISEVLMRQRFEDGTRHLGHSALGIVAVVEFTGVPLSVLLVDVTGQTGQQFVGKVTGGQSGKTGIEGGVTEGCHTDAQGACVRLTVACIAGIAVNGQRQFDGHPASCRIGHIAGAATQQIGHIGSHVDIVAIVVLTLLAAIDLVWHACPLGEIAGAFQTTGHPTEFSATLDVAHATSEAYGIGCHNTRLAAEVGEHHAVLLVAAFVKVEGAEIHPGRATHLLIDVELGGYTLMPHRVTGIIDTAFNSLITDIDGIASCLGDGRLVGDEALASGLCRCRCHTDGTCLEGILMIHVVTLMQGEAGLWGILPLACLFHIACGHRCRYPR